MITYTYPAIFHYADEGISVSFPDLQGCLTCGDTEQEALYMAKDVLYGWVYLCNQDNEELPNPSEVHTIKLESDEKIKLITVELKRH